MMKKNVIIVCLLAMCFVLFFTGIQENSDGYYIPKEGFVPNKETAIKIAEAIWLPIYGKQIYDEQPFVAELSKDKKVWVVSGTLPKGYVGGTAYAEIRKSDCKIINVTHGK